MQASHLSVSGTCAILPSMRTVLIRREGDKRLYNTERMTFVSLSDVAAMLMNGERIVVEDAATGEDVTSEILDKILDKLHR
jgi:polyhydroxyalkanoate synthesis regulator protein